MPGCLRDPSVAARPQGGSGQERGPGGSLVGKSLPRPGVSPKWGGVGGTQEEKQLHLPPGSRFWSGPSQRVGQLLPARRHRPQDSSPSEGSCYLPCSGGLTQALGQQHFIHQPLCPDRGSRLSVGQGHLMNEDGQDAFARLAGHAGHAAQGGGLCSPGGLGPGCLGMQRPGSHG